MITYLLVCIVASLAAGLAIQNYEELVLKIEIAGYVIEANTVFIVFMACALALLLAALLRLCLACALLVYKIKCKSVARQYESLGRGYALLSLGGAMNHEQIVNTVEKLRALDRYSLAMLETCAWFRLGQYEMAEKPLLLLKGSSLPDARLGLWLVESLNGERSKDCRLRVLRRLRDVFHRAPWAAMFRLEIARIEGDWDTVLVEVKLAAKRGIVLPYKHERMADIACLMLARSCYQRGDYKEGLKLVGRATDMHAAILKAKTHEKLGNPQKARDALEACYKTTPHPEIVTAYLAVSQDYDTATERLSSLNPDHYVSMILSVKRYMNAKQYNAAEQHAKRAIARYKYVELYCLMADVMARIGNIDEVVYWITKMQKDSVPNMQWRCTKCCSVSPEWSHECSACNAFDSVQWLG
ncbi:hypothetical protein DOS86_01005 [Anaplasma marginale]|uniref:CDC27 family protein n=1 Tax=Anaplasma marginale TaxID=770 RepID=UPI000DEF5863|nr:CDC27 family protein [Anaplasma marginale]RCL20008.1 hypothetical protein DOS86_01005 [Anaplasma marginale]TZF78544.1 hypothetical protein FY180_02855 [Anaplasma marginale]